MKICFICKLFNLLMDCMLEVGNNYTHSINIQLLLIDECIQYFSPDKVLISHWLTEIGSSYWSKYRVKWLYNK